MFSAYLVEDEPLVLAAMRDSVPWVENNLDIVGSNTDPAAALQEIMALRPDVVFTDIKMPAMSGLDLIHEIRKFGLDCEFVVISAHERFEYARELMLMDGFDYLIKPMIESQYLELFRRLLSKLEKKHGSRRLPQTSSSELNKIIAYLNRNLSKKHTLQQIAQLFNISSNYICQLFSKHLNDTFSNYLTGLRMEHAARLLKCSDRTVKEVAALSGYDDYFYFCRVFRGYHHCTPTQYRSGV